MNNSGIFIPICLYASSFYYKKRNLEELERKILIKYDKALVIIADDLRAYNLIIQNKEVDINEALKKSTHRGNEIENMINKFFKNRTSKSFITLNKWNFYIHNPIFIKIKSLIEREIENNLILKNIVLDFISYNLKKFGVDQNIKNNFYEFKYITEEITMSIYVTEILNYNTELWEKQDIKTPDPISEIYLNCSDFLKKIINKNKLHRNLIYLNSEI